MKLTIVESWQNVEMLKTPSTCPLPHPASTVCHSGLFSPVPMTHFGEIQKFAPFPVPQWEVTTLDAKATDLNVWLHISYHRLWLIWFNSNFCIVHWYTEQENETAGGWKHLAVFPGGQVGSVILQSSQCNLVVLSGQSSCSRKHFSYHGCQRVNFAFSSALVIDACLWRG